MSSSRASRLRLALLGLDTCFAGVDLVAWTKQRTNARRLGIESETTRRASARNEIDRLRRITIDPNIFQGKPIVRDRRLAVEHVLAMLAAGDRIEAILKGYPWLEEDDVLACIAYAHRVVAHERVDPALGESAA